MAPVDPDQQFTLSDDAAKPWFCIFTKGSHICWFWWKSDYHKPVLKREIHYLYAIVTPELFADILKLGFDGCLTHFKMSSYLFVEFSVDEQEEDLCFAPGKHPVFSLQPAAYPSLTRACSPVPAVPAFGDHNTIFVHVGLTIEIAEIAFDVLYKHVAGIAEIKIITERYQGSFVRKHMLREYIAYFFR
ncbi:MAG TPA: hypothetical protein PL124_05485 [Candidatus Cloacimonadota bacterium]|nr:hypothetical protein [Candidatus Cloacimonadota bacterium]